MQYIDYAELRWMSSMEDRITIFLSIKRNVELRYLAVDEENTHERVIRNEDNLAEELRTNEYNNM